MRRLLLLGVLTFCVSVGLWAGEEAKKLELKIGVIAPLSGNQGFMGEDVRDGITLALEDLGKTKVAYKFIYEDDMGINRVTNEAVSRLISLNKVDMIYTLWTPAANIVGIRTEAAKVIQFNTSWDPEPCTKWKWTLVYGASLDEFARKTVDIFKKAGCKRVAIASFVHLGNQKVITAALPLFEKERIKIVFDEQVNPDERDFRVYLLKIRESKPDGIWQLWYAPQDEIFNRQAHILGIRWPVSVGYFDLFPQESLCYLDGNLFPSELWARADFTSKFKSRFGHGFTTRAAHVYDMTTIVVKTTEEFYASHNRLPTHEELLALLKTPRELPNLMVGPGRMHKNGWIEVPYAIRKVKDGKIVDVKE